jgi:hypothetical protein
MLRKFQAKIVRTVADDSSSLHASSHMFHERFNPLPNNGFPILNPSVQKSSLHEQPIFPIKLREMLESAESEGYQDIVSWLPHGQAFRVHNPNKFMVRIAPTYFNQSKYKSFQRQVGISFIFLDLSIILNSVASIAVVNY